MSNSVFHIIFHDELAISLVKDPGDAKMGIEVQISGGTIRLTWWENTDGERKEYRPNDRDRDLSLHFLHPRAKAEIARILNIKEVEGRVSLKDFIGGKN